ncbi:MAG TPA: HK97 family phage prohead protease [Candidatus Acidoferrum sp.]|nr:HK97 family phage prohead protease [Candidatus Acidoferrum sp.]
MEKRSIAALAEIRANESKFQLTGRAVAYNTPSADNVPAPGWREVVAPGAFRKTLSASDCDIRALWGHDTTKPLGRQKNGTLKIMDSASGLDYVLQLDKTSQFHQDCFASVKRGDVDAMSFMFVPVEQDFDEAAHIRTVTAATIHEISFVTFPAYDKGTSAEARARAAAKKAPITTSKGLLESIAILRKAAQIAARSFAQALALEPGAGTGGYTGFASQSAACHELAEYCHSQMCQADDALRCEDDDYDAGDEGDYRSAWRKAMAHSKLHCDSIAEARLLHSKRKKK